jgi:hypothetical protein
MAETVLDLARPWPLKLVVDNAIGGQALGGFLSPLDALGPERWRGPQLSGGDRATRTRALQLATPRGSAA